jgi:hypothetical protein
VTRAEYPHQYDVGEPILFWDSDRPTDALIGLVRENHEHYWIVSRVGKKYKIWKLAFDLPKGAK